MDVVFAGVPTRREIELHLRSKRFSLLNNRRLRRDILAGRSRDEGRSQNRMVLCRDFLRMEEDAERMLRRCLDVYECMPIVQEIAERAGALEQKPVMASCESLCAGGDVVSGEVVDAATGFRYTKIPGPLQAEAQGKTVAGGTADYGSGGPKKHARVTSTFLHGRRILGEKSINTAPRTNIKKMRKLMEKNTEINTGRRHVKFMKRLVEKNTEINTGYRYVKLTYKGRGISHLYREAPNILRERKVTFGDIPRNAVHNDGAVVSILLSPKKPKLGHLPRSKELVRVQSLVGPSGSFAGGNFEYRFSR
jgi:hypothetical protein